MDEALTAIDLGEFASRRAATEAAGRLRGLGIANTIEQSAGVTDEWATIRFDPSGIGHRVSRYALPRSRARDSVSPACR